MEDIRGDQKPKERERYMKRDGVDIRPASVPLDRPVDQRAQSRGQSIAQSIGVHKRA